MPQVEIQRLVEADVERLRRLRLAALADAPDAFGSTLADALQFTQRDWARQLAELPTFVALVGASDVGMVRCAADEDAADAACLLSMWVAPQARGKGAGEALIDAVASWARAQGFARVVLDVADGNVPAIALYARCGFHANGATGALPPPREHVLEHQRERRLQP